jgi:hypothetical protein
MSWPQLKHAVATGDDLALAGSLLSDQIRSADRRSRFVPESVRSTVIIHPHEVSNSGVISATATKRHWLRIAIVKPDAQASYLYTSTW